MKYIVLLDQEIGENAMNAANILKPALASGEIQDIGTTTLREYRKYIEKDSALERRFQTVIVEEPNEDATTDILAGIKKYYEDFHKVKISNEVIRQTVSMSEKYIHDSTQAYCFNYYNSCCDWFGSRYSGFNGEKEWFA